MMGERIDGLSCGYNNVRFTGPVFFGDTITVFCTSPNAATPECTSIVGEEADVRLAIDARKEGMGAPWDLCTA
ncbi:MAG TPA: hypothetical protein VF428_09970 [Casimicrobiaceae bacterium]